MDGKGITLFCCGVVLLASLLLPVYSQADQTKHSSTILFLLPAVIAHGSKIAPIDTPPTNTGYNTLIIHPPSSAVTSSVSVIDGTVDNYLFQDYTYNAKGQLLSMVDKVYVSSTIYKIYKYTYTYNSNGQLISVSDGSSSTTYTYNSNGQLISDSSGHTYTYNSNGQLISVSDGSIIRTYTYNSYGQLISEILDWYSNNNDTIDLSYTSTYTYNSNGQLISKIFEGDSGNNGTIDSRETLTYTYNSNGQLISIIIEDDSDNNGTIDKKYITKFTINSGVNYTPVFKMPLAWRALYFWDFHSRTP